MSPEQFSGKRFLAEWKTFRRSLSDFDESVDMVIDFWRDCPTVNRSIDPTDCTSWPTAWEMIDSGLICQFGLGLGMAYTLVYANPNWSERVRLVFAQTESDQSLLVIIDNRWVLNYSYGDKQSIESAQFRILEEFKFDGNKFIAIKRTTE